MKGMRTALRVGGLVIVVLVSVAAGSCPSGIEEIIFNEVLSELQGEIESEYGFTVHVVLPPLGQGTVIVPDTPGGYPAGGAKLECEGRSGCVLVMLDLMPRAHFAHPVILAFFDLEYHELTHIESEWWPYDPYNNIRYFSTVAERRQTVVCHPEHDCSEFFPVHEPAWDVTYTLAPPSPVPFGLPDEEPPNVWAVIVNGYDDESDSFDEDTDGIYQVLKGMGVNDDQICYLTEQATPGKDSIARHWNVRDALMYITLRTGGDLGGADPAAVTAAGEPLCVEIPGGSPFLPKPASDLLFFYSSHGAMASDPTTAKVLCNHKYVHWSEPGYIESDELFDWLDPINAKRMAVVIEACHSGGFKNQLVDLKETHDNVSLFFSSAINQASFADVDPSDDENPGDAGSETIWGFIEAFGTSAADRLSQTGGPCDTGGLCANQDNLCADSSNDGVITFGEAVCYAKANDKTPGVHDSPFAVHDDDPPAGPFLAMDPVVPTTLIVPSDPETQTTTIDDLGNPVSLVKRCNFNDVSFDVQNTGLKGLAVASVRFHIEEAGDIDFKDWDHSQTVILPALKPTDSAHLKIRIRAGDDLENGEIITLRATIDSPQSPFDGDLANRYRGGKGEVVDPSCALMACGCRTAGGT